MVDNKMTVVTSISYISLTIDKFIDKFFWTNIWPKQTKQHPHSANWFLFHTASNQSLAY